MRNPSSSSSTARNPSPGARTPTPCCSKVGLKRGPWTPEEDELLAGYIRREGEGRWRTLPKRAGLLRCGKSCRLRWMNYLRPSVKRGNINPDEEDLILRLHRLLGNRWSLIAGRIPGRTDNEIKNYWNTHLSKKLVRQGIDPRTHKPLNLNPSPDQVAASSGGQCSEGGDTWRGPHDLMMMPPLQSSQRGDDGMECSSDDIFSSFLNSLIIEDTFTQQQQLSSCVFAPQEQFIAGVSTFWEAAGTSGAGFSGVDEEVFDHQPA